MLRPVVECVRAWLASDALRRAVLTAHGSDAWLAEPPDNTADTPTVIARWVRDGLQMCNQSYPRVFPLLWKDHWSVIVVSSRTDDGRWYDPHSGRRPDGDRTRTCAEFPIGCLNAYLPRCKRVDLGHANQGHGADVFGAAASGNRAPPAASRLSFRCLRRGYTETARILMYVLEGELLRGKSLPDVYLFVDRLLRQFRDHFIRFATEWDGGMGFEGKKKPISADQAEEMRQVFLRSDVMDWCAEAMGDD